MQTVYLGFKAFDIHELGCHFVASHAGIYEAQGLRVRLIDTTFTTDEQLPPLSFQAACGSALAGWLKGAPFKVVFVATDHPMFWLHGRAGLTWDKLKGGTIAGFPSAAPPSHFLRHVLGKVGLDSASDVKVLSVRDDVARLGLLRSGDVDAAVVSSAVLPPQAESCGFSPMAFIGDVVRVPTTGLAVHASALREQTELVRSMCRAYRMALHVLHTDYGLLSAALMRFPGFQGEDAAAACEIIRTFYTRDGRSAHNVLEHGIELMRSALGLEGELPAESLYDFSLLTD